jgi:hypothetical protein
MEINETANKLYKYNQEFYNISLDKLVQNTHKYNCEKNKWIYYPLKKGSFGYDNLAVSIGYSLSNYNNEGINKLAYLIHEGWIINYIYWKDYLPFDRDVKYIKPFNPLNDERRNKCAITKFEDLEKEEQDKDYVIAEYLYEIIKNYK